jgi:L-lactate dehydrogenase
MPSHHTRISIIGCGHVGTSCAYAILHNHLAREIVLIGDTEDHVHGEALDLQQAVPLGTPVKNIRRNLQRRSGRLHRHHVGGHTGEV